MCIRHASRCTIEPSAKCCQEKCCNSASVRSEQDHYEVPLVVRAASDAGSSQDRAAPLGERVAVREVVLIRSRQQHPAPTSGRLSGPLRLVQSVWCLRITPALRLNLRIAIEAFITRIEDFTLAPGFVPRYMGGITRSLRQLPLIFEPRIVK